MLRGLEAVGSLSDGLGVKIAHMNNLVIISLQSVAILFE